MVGINMLPSTSNRKLSSVAYATTFRGYMAVALLGTWNQGPFQSAGKFGGQLPRANPISPHDLLIAQIECHPTPT